MMHVKEVTDIKVYYFGTWNSTCCVHDSARGACDRMPVKVNVDLCQEINWAHQCNVVSQRCLSVGNEKVKGNTFSKNLDCLFRPPVRAENSRDCVSTDFGATCFSSFILSLSASSKIATISLQ